MKKIKIDKLNNIGKLREDSCIDRRTAAKNLECSEAFLCQIEKKGTAKKPSVSTAQKMCILYKCTLDDIFPSKRLQAN